MPGTDFRLLAARLACDNDAADHCSGAVNTCVDAYKAASVVCRADAGDCDVAEYCTGSSGSCPANGFEATGVSCGITTASVCDNPDSCDGAGACQANNEPSTTVCRAAAGECDVAESCDGAGACPSDAFKAAGTACGVSSSDQCDNADSCNSTGVCLSNNVANGTACNDGNACTDNDSCQAGVCASVPGLFAADAILWQAPLAVSPANEDTDPSNVNLNDTKAGIETKYAFKIGSTIPVPGVVLVCGWWSR